MHTTHNELNLTREEAIRVKIPLREALIGDRNFYRRAAAVVLPMMLQNTLTNIVSLLDNVMVGRVGTLPMSAVAIVNQMFFVLYLCIFGSLSGAGIYSTQFFGKQDEEGVRVTVRIKIVIVTVIVSVAMILFLTCGTWMIGRYIAADTSAADAAQTMHYARTYLLIMLVGFYPFGFTQVLGGTMRESGQTTLPMIASVAAMAVNFVLNLLLIFGYLGFPRLGVAGAAIATVISRFVELLIILVGALRDKEKYGFFRNVFHPFHIPGEMVLPILSKSMPLMVNEFFFSFGMAVLMQCYSVRGLNIIAAMNISQTVANVFTQAFMSLGGATGIIVGQELGAGRLVSARRIAWQLTALSVAVSVLFGLALFAVAPVFPQIYNTEPEIRRLATNFIRVQGLCMAIMAYGNNMYFTLRSGGKIFITILFDSCFVWAVSVPVAYLLAHLTALPALSIYLTVTLLDLIKCVIGHMMVHKGIWVKNIVADL